MNIHFTKLEERENLDSADVGGTSLPPRKGLVGHLAHYWSYLRCTASNFKW